MGEVQSFIIVCCILTGSANDLDPAELSKKLQEIKIGIGTEEIQKEFNRVPYSTKTENGAELLKGILNNLEAELKSLEQDVLNSIKQTISDNQNKFTFETELPLCCDNTGSYKYDPNFRVEVDFSTACITKPPVSSSNTLYPNKPISDVMKQQYEQNRNVLWQHYGTTEGVAVIYPSTYWANCEEYDPRFRSAFSATASSKKKDVVIVLDTSSSMKQISGDRTKTKMVIAKEAAVIVLQTLNPNDRVAVLSFSAEVNTPGQPGFNKCYQDTLAFASKTNIDTLRDYVYSISETNNADSNFEKALLKAFAYLGTTNSTDVSSRDQVILFLTDGGSDIGRDPVDVIRDENAKLNNRVVVFTYLLGPVVSEDVKQQLMEMATQVNSNSSSGSIREGRYTYVDQSSHRLLAMKMATFFEHLQSLTNVATALYTIPYVDPFSEKGLITSICKSVLGNSGLQGVVCTDIKLSELLKEVEYFYDGSSSYGFVIDETGRALIHPLLSDAKFVNQNEDPVLVDISTLERSVGVSDIIKSMKRGETSSKYVSAVYFTSPRGRLENDGSIVQQKTATYYWGPVVNSKFYVCIVMGVTTHSEITEAAFPSTDFENTFLYHNRSLVGESFHDCRFNSRKVTLAKSSVKFTPSAFQDPFQYIDKDETPFDVRQYENYFTRRSNVNPGFKSSVRPTLWTTYAAEHIWKGSTSNHLAWRYLGTTDGLIRVFPAVSLTKNYDHEKRTWWRQTVSHPGITYITQPYDDAWGSGILITLAHTIYKKDSTQVIGVIATDFPLQYFSWFIDQIFPQCQGSEYKCMIIDDSGFLVMHPTFKDEQDASAFQDPIHLTVQEPVLAKSMLYRGVMHSQECQDFSENKELKSFRVTLPPEKPLGLSFLDTSDSFELRPVENTNIFVLRIRSGSILDKTPPSCTCDKNLKPGTRLCTCDCLCYTPILFDVCSNTYPGLTDSSLPCSARLLDTSSIIVEEDFKGLATCYDPKCYEKTSKIDCYSDSQCSWCEFTDLGDILSPPCCKLKGDCSFGKTKSSNRNICEAPVIEHSNEKSGSNNVGVIFGAVVGTIVVIILVIGSIFIYRRFKKDDPYLDVVADKTYEECQNCGFESSPDPDELYLSPSEHGGSYLSPT